MIKVELLPGEEYVPALKRTVASLGQPKRQEIMDLLWAGNSIGKIVEKLQIETVIIGQVVADNINTHTHHELSKVAK